MSGTTDELSKTTESKNEEELISETLSQQKIGDVSNENDEIALCANCGKEGSNFNICNKCKDATYCNAACKKKHRKRHKKKCEKRVAELHEEKLFKEPPPQFGDCPICFLLLPTMDNGKRYNSCCGKIICSGCSFADVFDNHGEVITDEKCPFCRTPDPTSYEEAIKRLKKRMEVGDPCGYEVMGDAYDRGLYGLTQNSAKAIELWRKAGKYAYTNIGYAYDEGVGGVERDKKMAQHYYELAAMEGDVAARYNLGYNEYKAGNYDRALKHYMISVRGGCTDSAKCIQHMYKDGHATKDHYASALQSHQSYVNEIKSEQRDKAAAFSDNCCYY